jgi:SAM-dependent methyltransferase
MTDDALAAALDACAAGALAPPLAAMRLLIAASDLGQARRVHERAVRRADAEGQARLATVAALLEANPEAFGLVRAVARAVPHETAEGDGLGRWSALFDAAVRISPEASVALYSLGNPEILAAATEEIVDVLAAWNVLGTNRDALDIGCGIGRLEAALAQRLRSIVGTDVSAEMLAVAGQRCADHPNIAFVQVSGRDLEPFADLSVDLLLAADSWPYLVLSGVAGRHAEEAARVLRPGGDLVILNVSYRGDDEADRADMARLAEAYGFTVRRAGERPFRLWDACAFHLRRQG